MKKGKYRTESTYHLRMNIYYYLSIRDDGGTYHGHRTGLYRAVTRWSVFGWNRGGALFVRTRGFKDNGSLSHTHIFGRRVSCLRDDQDAYCARVPYTCYIPYICMCVYTRPRPTHVIYYPYFFIYTILHRVSCATCSKKKTVVSYIYIYFFFRISNKVKKKTTFIYLPTCRRYR